MYDVKTLEAVVAARKHLRSDRELTSFSAGRSIPLKVNSIPYTIEGYVEDNQLYFNLVTNMKGIEPKAIASHVPLISNIACVSDHYQGQLVRCRNMSGNHDWSLEYTKPLEVILSEYELLPGSQPDEANGLVYLSNDKGEILSVEGHYLTIFEPVRDVELRMALEQTLTALQKEIMNVDVSSDQLINAAFMVERSLNAGHIDMIELDVGSVVAAAQEQLGIAGKSELSDDLASLSDRYDSSSKPQVTFGLG